MNKTNIQYHYFYKITNKINNHFYYGVHNKNNLNDGYMGSGKRLHYAYKKYGIENFKKEILKYFNTSKEAFEYEAEIVNEELIKNDNCYNIQMGGKTFNTKGLVPAKDKNGNCFDVSKDDERLLNGELVGVTKGYITVKDNKNNYFYISKEDERYLSGELKFMWYNRHHTEETKNKISQSLKNNKSIMGNKNSQFNTCWIYNLDKKQSIKIKNEQLNNYIKLGWIKGRKMKFN